MADAASEPTLGDTVRVAAGAPGGCRPGALASVVGLPDGPNPDFTIEFGDGSDTSISPDLIELVESYETPDT